MTIRLLNSFLLRSSQDQPHVMLCLRSAETLNLPSVQTAAWQCAVALWSSHMYLCHTQHVGICVDTHVLEVSTTLWCTNVIEHETITAVVVALCTFQTFKDLSVLASTADCERTRTSTTPSYNLASCNHTDEAQLQLARQSSRVKKATQPLRWETEMCQCRHECHLGHCPWDIVCFAQ